MIAIQIFALLLVAGCQGRPLDDLTPAAQMIFRPIFLYRQEELSKRLEKRKTINPTTTEVPASPASVAPPSPSVIPASPATSAPAIPAQPAILAQNPSYPPPSLFYNFQDGRYYYYYRPYFRPYNTPQKKQ